MADTYDDHHWKAEFDSLGEEIVRKKVDDPLTPERWRRAAVRWVSKQNLSRATAEKEHRENERAIAKWTRVLGWFTVVLAGTSAVTVGILYRTDETSRLRDRAFVYFTEPSFFKWPAVNPNVLAVTMHLINTGNMPARRVVIKFSCPTPLKTEEAADPYKIATWATSEAPNVIGPKQPLDLQSCSIPLAAFEKAETGASDVFMMFEVTYFRRVRFFHTTGHTNEPQLSV